MIRFPGAKINIGLYVTSKRDDGYHNIESVFYPLPIHDVLEAVPSKESACNLDVRGLPIEGDLSNNLVNKAWQLLHEAHGIPGVEAMLFKNIPMGAGLGGGSSDGAHMLLLLNELFNLQLSEVALLDFAAGLGSDCPFFIRNEAAYVSGRGELLSPLPLSLKENWLALIHPGIHVGTAEAYGLIQPSDPSLWVPLLAERKIDLRELGNMERTLWPQIALNQFEAPVCKRHPQISEAIKVLKDAGAWFQSMSGSGSAVYGLFQSQPELPMLPDGWTSFSCVLL